MHDKNSQFILLKIPSHLVSLLGKIHALSIEVLCSIIMTVRHLYDCDVLCGGNTGMILLLSFKFDL